MSGFIPKEKLTAYERWELASFDESVDATGNVPDADTAVETVEETIPLPTAEDIERIQQEAFASGHAEGHAAGHTEGFASGREEGLANGKAESDQQIARLSELMQHLSEDLGRFDQIVADHILAVALETARQVLRHEAKTNPEQILPVIREALTALPPHLHGHPLLFLHPEDAELVREQMGEQLAHGNWRILEDSALTRGGCRIEAGASEVDATVESRWRRALEAIGVDETWLEEQP